MILLRLFFEYFKVGLFSIGGGLATIPFLSELADKTGWYTQADLADMIAISESTPGPIGVNMASNVGFATAGIPGVLAATLGLVTPSVIVIILVVRMIEKYSNNPLINSAFYGLRPASMALITAAGLEVAEVALLNLDAINGGFINIFDYKSIILAVVLFFAMKKFKVHPIVYMAVAAVVGIIFNFAP